MAEPPAPPRFVTLPEIRQAARRRLPRPVWNFGAGGAETETTRRRNRRHLDRLAIQQNVLVDVGEVDLRTSLLGVPLAWPVTVAPMGGLVLFHPEGDLEMARGTAQAGTLLWVSGSTGWPVEQVAKAGAGPQMFQLYHHGDRGWVSELLARTEASGYQAIALTVDVQLYGRRGRDARRAVDMGVRLIWVSNHGGRQLDHAQSTIDALPPIVDAVAGAAAIVIDGGFSRGTDVVKGLARGATAVAVGRTVLWGLGADGAPGVARALEILREEVRTTMGLCGRTRIADLTPDLIFRID